jgi:hypothetical protein
LKGLPETADDPSRCRGAVGDIRGFQGGLPMASKKPARKKVAPKKPAKKPAKKAAKKTVKKAA